MYILYNPNKSTTIINIINYLYYMGYNLVPSNYIENRTSVIRTNLGQLFVGEIECIKFFTEQTLITHLSEKANEFDRLNSYRKLKIE